MKIFFDDRDLPVGNVISPSLSKAIEESKILIIVFSKNYASSTWCLDELVKILEQSKISEMKQLVFPVFYHVDPSDVRKQTESYGEHMTKHEENFGKASQKLQAWRTALFEASNFPGHHITTGSVPTIPFMYIYISILRLLSFQNIDLPHLLSNEIVVICFRFLAVHHYVQNIKNLYIQILI